MIKKIIEEIKILRDFCADIELRQKIKSLETIKQDIKFFEGKIAAYAEILSKIESETK